MLPKLSKVTWHDHARRRLNERVGNVRPHHVWGAAHFWGRAGRYYAWNVRIGTQDFALLSVVQHRRWVVITVWPLAWWEARVATWHAAS